MQSLGVISPVDEPTLWCAGMVMIPKSSGGVRICVDLKPLNEGVLQEFHPLPKVEETLGQLNGATIFSKVDANSGFWQILLARKSKLLTTFLTPFGRYYFNKLPFGIFSAPQFFLDFGAQGDWQVSCCAQSSEFSPIFELDLILLTNGAQPFENIGKFILNSDASLLYLLNFHG